MTWQGSDAGGGGGSDDASRSDTGDVTGPGPSANPVPGQASPPPVPQGPASASFGAPPPPPGVGAPPPPPPAGQPGAPPSDPGAPWAPAPPTSRFAVPGAPGLEYAGTLVRVVAYLIDFLVLLVPTFVVSVAIGAAAPGSEAASYVGGLITTVIEAAYFTLLWTSAGRATLGMRLLKLQIGNAVDGRRIRPGQAIRRWLAYGLWVPAVIAWPALAVLSYYAVVAWIVVLLVTIAMSPTKQGLHDRVAETAVVQPTGGAASQAALGCLAIVLVVLMVIVSLVAALIFLGSQVSTILSDIGSSV